MKRFFFLVIAVLFVLSAGCSKSGYGPEYDSVNNLDGVTLMITELHDTYAVIAFQNDSSTEVGANGDYYIEKLIDESWNYIPYESSVSDRPPFPSLGIRVAPGERSDIVLPQPETVYFDYLNGITQLSPGIYRIIKPVFVLTTREDGTREQSDWYYLSAEFTIE